MSGVQNIKQINDVSKQASGKIQATCDELYNAFKRLDKEKFS